MGKVVKIEWIDDKKKGLLDGSFLLSAPEK
jgi:hypothetical protein